MGKGVDTQTCGGAVTTGPFILNPVRAHANPILIYQEKMAVAYNNQKKFTNTKNHKTPASIKKKVVSVTWVAGGTPVSITPAHEEQNHKEYGADGTKTQCDW